MDEELKGAGFSIYEGPGQIDLVADFKGGDEERNFKEMELGRFYILTLVFSIITFILDLYLHCWLAYGYYKENESKFFAFTLIFLVIPALMSSAFSMRWYLQDEDEPSVKRQSLWKWVVRIIMLVLQLAPLLRYYDTLAYGITSYIHKKKGNLLNQQKYLRLMLDEESNACLLRLISCFLLSAPQAIIQLVFLLSKFIKSSNFDEYYYLSYQIWAIFCSIISISWALTAYYRSVRLVREDKEKLNVASAIFMFCWNVFSAVSRVLALSLLAALYPAWFISFCLTHWLIMTLWIDIIHHHSTLCASRCEEIIFNIALGLAYVIAFISPKDGPTRYLYLAYYLVCFVENTAAVIVWGVASTSIKNPGFHYGIIAIQIVSFLLCIFFIISYYRCHHPSGTSAIIKKTISITEAKYAKS